MPVLFLDTNIFLRYLTQDNQEQSARAYRLLRQVEAGTVIATTSEAIIAEIVHVLSSKALYNVPRPEIRERVGDIIQLKGLKLPAKATYLRALDLYATTALDFVDCLSVAQMERGKITVILSFDRDFDRISTVTRQEP